MRNIVLTLIAAFIFTLNINAQESPERFNKEIMKFAKIKVDDSKDIVVFTGSSSVRMWEDLKSDCSTMQVVNTGFGGSQMTDLLFFIEETVIKFNPTKVFIYEGDNDISAEIEPSEIFETTKLVFRKLLKSNPGMEIHFISPKPSPARWSMVDKYLEYNALLQDYCQGHESLFYVDVWNAMIDEDGRPISDIFTSDSLHMNRDGYLLWKDVMCK